MSAFQFSHDGIHRVIDAIRGAQASAGEAISPILTASDGTLGAELLQMNYDALAQAYPYPKVEKYFGTRPRCLLARDDAPASMSTIQHYKTLMCFIYQCAEGDVDARTLFQALCTVGDWYERCGCNANALGYDAAVWG